MRLSEAIRIGAMTCPQGFGTYYTVGADGTPLEACALGAALIAVGGLKVLDSRRGMWHMFDREFMGVCLSRLLLECPYPHCQCGRYRRSVYESVIHLNDFHAWSREKIAAWVERVEDAWAGPAAAEAAVPVPELAPA